MPLGGQADGARQAADAGADDDDPVLGQESLNQQLTEPNAVLWFVQVN
jgi:hypothetical protein